MPYVYNFTSSPHLRFEYMKKSKNRIFYFQVMQLCCEVLPINNFLLQVVRTFSRHGKNVSNSMYSIIFKHFTMISVCHIDLWKHAMFQIAVSPERSID